MLTAVGLVFMSHSSGIATVRQEDRTGSPLELNGQCDQCHGGGSFSPSIAMQLKDGAGNIATKYVPGQSYTYEVEITSTAGGYGFQSVALLNDNANAGTLSENSANAKIVALNNRSYAEQKTTSGTGLFIMDWVAPAKGSGDVNFYAAGVAVNDNNNSQMDNAVTGTPIIVTEDLSSGLEEEKEIQINIYPNPTSENINIEMLSGQNYSLEIADISGKIVFSIERFNSKISINVDSWSKGTYFVRVTGEKSWVKKINKI